MSRDREQQRRKRSELARQLGVGRAEVDDHTDLQRRERVTRPVLQLLARTPSQGLVGKLLRPRAALVLALYLVESKGARLVHALALDDARHELDKLRYRRPAHFVIVVLSPADPVAVLAELQTASVRLDGLDIASDAIAAADWEVPRRVRVAGLSVELEGAALSIRAMGRSEARIDFPLEKGTATLALEI